MTFDPVPRPPLGVKPRKFWLQDRAQELSRAIHDQLSQGYGGTVRPDLVLTWTNELAEILPQIGEAKALYTNPASSYAEAMRS